jgi:hypothetical protein
MALRKKDEHTKCLGMMDQDSQESPLSQAPTRGGSPFIRVSDERVAVHPCPDDGSTRVAPWKKWARGVPDTTFMFNKLGNFATMIMVSTLSPRPTRPIHTTKGFTCGHVEPLGRAQKSTNKMMKRKRMQMGKQTWKVRKMKQMMVKKRRRKRDPS